MLVNFLAYVFVVGSVSASSLHQLSRRQGVAYYNPNVNGGSEIDNATGTLGKPTNVIVSGLSSPHVLTDDGFLNYAQSIGL